LNKSPQNYCKLEIFKDIVTDKNISQVNIFTLNHDLVLEDAFSKWNIKYNDGFSEPINNIRYWENGLIYKKKEKVKIIKLHGSINWFRYRIIDGDWNNESIGIPLSHDYYHTKNPDGKNQWPPDGRPKILVGTFNKMLQYTSGIYTTLFTEFNRLLDDLSIILVSGYGFGDKGINSRIIEWIYLSEEKHIVVIHPKPDDLLNSARGAISNKWIRWVNSKKLLVIPSGIEEVKWPELKEKIARNFK